MNNRDELDIIAFDIATQLHKRQIGKAGVDYIEHPMRVSKECRSMADKYINGLKVLID